MLNKLCNTSFQDQQLGARNILTQKLILAIGFYLQKSIFRKPG